MSGEKLGPPQAPGGENKDPPSGLADSVASRPLPGDIQALIGRRLVAAYDEVLRQPIPDRFRRLLDDLEANPHVATKSPSEGK